MGHIFISYSHKDKDYVEKLEKKLIDEGFDVWIDHRIDYGTQWPKEIQKALDACDAFIVVVSENASESKWAQNEVARADRKKKPFFPVWLDGDLWLSIETTQAADVRNGRLPTKDFYEQLGYVAERGVTYNDAKWYFVSDWPTYHNVECGFSFKYPENGKLTTSDNGNVVISIPIVSGTDLRRKTLFVECFDEKLFEPKRIEFGSTKKIWLGQRQFLTENYQEVGAGSYSDTIRCSTLCGDKYLSVTLVVLRFSPYLFYPKLITRVDGEFERELAMMVASSLKCA